MPVRSGSIIQPVDSLATGPEIRPKRVPLTQRSSASPLEFIYLLVSLRPSSRCLRLLPRLPVTCFLPSIFPSVNYKFFSSALDVCEPPTSHFGRFNTGVPSVKRTAGPRVRSVHSQKRIIYCCC